MCSVHGPCANLNADDSQHPSAFGIYCRPSATACYRVVYSFLIGQCSLEEIRSGTRPHYSSVLGCFLPFILLYKRLAPVFLAIYTNQVCRNAEWGYWMHVKYKSSIVVFKSFHMSRVGHGGPKTPKRLNFYPSAKRELAIDNENTGIIALQIGFTVRKQVQQH